ncbi:hypothetical protein QTP86_003264 [Hemibagrus guttatus]|nr:hypothetical protein QTP86_003264 [Hemibagrus guttatus]
MQRVISALWWRSRFSGASRQAPQKPVPVPLIPLPIIGVPFEQVGMDFIRLLLKSAWGHEYILVMMDYATRYPKAVPVQKATSCSIARELLTLFSHVGIHHVGICVGFCRLST